MSRPECIQMASDGHETCLRFLSIWRVVSRVFLCISCVHLWESLVSTFLGVFRVESSRKPWAFSEIIGMNIVDKQDHLAEFFASPRIGSFLCPGCLFFFKPLKIHRILYLLQIWRWVNTVQDSLNCPPSWSVIWARNLPTALCWGGFHCLHWSTWMALSSSLTYDSTWVTFYSIWTHCHIPYSDKEGDVWKWKGLRI